MKEIVSGNFMKAWGGISSIQFALPVLWTAAKKQGAAIEDIGKWLAAKPALLPGLQETKGQIAKGFDADFVVWNPDESFMVTEELIQHRHKITPYSGKQLYGLVEQTWLAGERVFDHGKYLHLNRGKILNA